MIGLENFSESSFDYLWANHNKISPVDLVIDKFVQNTTVPTGTHPLPTGNHRLTELRYVV